MSAMDTRSILHTKEREVEDFFPPMREEQEDPPEPPPTCASPSTSSTTTQSEAQKEELRQLMDFLKSAEEKRQENRKADHRKLEELVNSFSSSCDKRKAE